MLWTRRANCPLVPIVSLTTKIGDRGFGIRIFPIYDEIYDELKKGLIVQVPVP
jgi:hypothetical protein